MARTTPVNSGYSIINGTTTGTNGGTTDTWIEYKVLSQSIINNTSQIRVILYSQNTAGKTSSYTGTDEYGWVGYDNGNKQWLTISGYNYANYNINKFADHTYTIIHNTDGTKTITLQGQFTTKSTYITGGSVSGQITLPQIARASSVSGLSTRLGTAGTITITRQSSSFTHTLTYSFGSASGTIATKTSNTSVSWTPPVSLISQFNNQTSKTGTITCTTYSGNTEVGTSTSTLTLSVPSSTLANLSGTIGSSVTLTATNPCTSGLTYTYQYSADGTNWTTIGNEKVSSKTQSWTPSASLIANIDNATSKGFNIRVITYRGTTIVNTATATATLSIPKTTSTNISGEIGSTITIPLNKAQGSNSNLTATITASLGNTSYVIVTKTQAVSVDWTPSNTWLNEITNSSSGIGSITIESFNGDASLGSNTYTLTLSVPSNIVPTSSLSIEVVNTNNVVDGWGIFLQGYSKAKATLTGTGISGSTISNMSVSGNGLNASSTPRTTPATLEATSSVISTSGTLSYTGEVSDSRGRSATTITTSIEVFPYAPPTITNVNVYRADAQGDEDTSGTYLKVNYMNSYSDANGNNSVTNTLRYRLKGAANWTNYGAVSNGDNLNINFLISNNYEVQLLVSDALNSNIPSSIISVPSAERVLNVNSSGSGLAVGGFSTMDGTFQEYYPARFGDDIYVSNGLPIKISDNLPLLTNGAYTSSSATGDADSMTEVGTYYVATAYVTNLPMASGNFGLLEVSRGSGATYKQTFTAYNSGRSFTRCYVGGRWYDWTENPIELDTSFTSVIQYTKEKYDYDTMLEDIDALASSYSMLNKVVLGQSLLGRDIIGLYFGSLSARYKTLILANEHGKEVHNTALTLRTIETICKNWNRKVNWDSKEVRQIFNDSCLLFIPRQNPDGAELVYYGFDSIPSSTPNRSTLVNNITNALINYVRVEGFPIWNFKSDWQWRSACIQDADSGRYTCPTYTFNEDDLYVWMSNLEGIDLQLNKWSAGTRANYDDSMSTSYPARKLTQGDFRVQDDIGTTGWGATENAAIKDYLYNNGFMKNILNLHQLHPFIEWRESQKYPNRDYEISKKLAEWCKTKLTNTNYKPLGIVGEAYLEYDDAYYATIETGYMYYPPYGNLSSRDDAVNTQTAFAYNQLPTMYEQYKTAFLQFHDVIGREQYFVHPLDVLTELTPINGIIQSVISNYGDLNDIKDRGVYSCIGTNTYYNLPSGATYGTLEVINTAGNYYTTQRFTNALLTATRIYTNNAWTGWAIQYYNDYTYTDNGLTIRARRRGNIVSLYVSGTPTTALNSGGANVTIATLPEMFRPSIAYVNYIWINATIMGQLNVSTAGAVTIGYTRTASTNSAINISTAIYSRITYEVN